MSDRLHIGVLGPLEITTSAGEAIQLPSTKQRRLLSILTLEVGHVIPADRLCDLLECSSGSLRTTVSRIRSNIGSQHLLTSVPGYRLAASTDIAEFESISADALRKQGADAIELLDQALSLWRGVALEEFRDESWALAEVARLDERRCAIIESRAELLLAEGDAATTIAEMKALVAHHPLRESPRRLAMRALSSEGRTAEALRVYQDFRRHLAEETGTEPSAAIRSLERAIASAPGEGGADLPVPVEPLAFMVTVHGDPPAGVEDAALDPLLSGIVANNHGLEIESDEGSRASAFDDPSDAVAAARETHRALTELAESPAGPTAVRIGLHYGVAGRRGENWSGPTLVQAHRIAALAHPGQVVVSETIASMLEVQLTDLGEHRLRDVQGPRRLYQLHLPGGPDRFAALRSIGAHLSTLPAQRSTLIGRDELVDRVTALLGQHRLVSLLGPGGVGKTRVAIDAGERSLGGFSGGVFFADLTSVGSDPEVAVELARAVTATVGPDQNDDEAVIEFLADRRALLVVDNCEHVLDRAALLIDEILVAAPEVRVLATSRAPLELRGERRLIVPSLGVDGPGSPAAQLYADRATALDDATAMGEEELAVVAEIVRRLDGIPLAIELAAAQHTTLDARTILDSLDDRFDLLTQRLRRVPPRQQTLAATIDWSYDLLTAEERRAFRRLAICAGAFSPRTAGGVLHVPADAAAPTLESLDRKSLLTRVRAEGRTLGYNMLESLREYGRERMAEEDELTDASLALENAVLPTVEAREDWNTLVNQYLCAAREEMVIEGATRLTAAVAALDAGRDERAAFIFSSVAYRDELGRLRARRDTIAPLADRGDELDPMAWLAANAAKLLLERSVRDYGACLSTAARLLEELEPDHPARSWFGLWQTALTTAVDPAAGIALADASLPAARRDAQEPLDWTLSQFLATKGTGLALLGRLQEADEVVAEAALWAPVGQESRDQILALRVWIGYLLGQPLGEDLAAEIAGQALQLGLAELCAAPGALCSQGTPHQRARRLVQAALRRPKMDLPTPYLLAFAWMHIEHGDHARARDLLASAEMYDSSTQVALAYALAAVDGWEPDNWDEHRDAMVERYLSADHEAAAELGSAKLDQAIEHWEDQLRTTDAP